MGFRGSRVRIPASRPNAHSLLPIEFSAEDTPALRFASLAARAHEIGLREVEKRNQKRNARASSSAQHETSAPDRPGLEDTMARNQTETVSDCDRRNPHEAACDRCRSASEEIHESAEEVRSFLDGVADILSVAIAFDDLSHDQRRLLQRLVQGPGWEHLERRQRLRESKPARLGDIRPFGPPRRREKILIAGCRFRPVSFVVLSESGISDRRTSPGDPVLTENERSPQCVSW